MLFKSQYQIDKHFHELEMGTGLILVSPVSKSKDLHYKRW